MGVRRAVEMALGETPGADFPVYTIGPLIHNPAVLETLKKRGIRVLKEGELPSPRSTVIIRAHGVPPARERELASLGARIIDATCPHVKSSQKKALSFAERGYVIFLAGEDNHAEIVGIRGYAESAQSCFVVANPAEAEAAAAAFAEKIAGSNTVQKTVLIAQTTFSLAEFEAIGEKIKKNFPSLEIVNTICGAMDRQDALRELGARVDAIIIAGGRDSANSRRLLSVAVEMGKPAWLVESAAELPEEIYSYNTVGLSAGASTPDEVIDDIEQTLRGNQ